MRPSHLLAAILAAAATSSAWQVTSWAVETTSVTTVRGYRTYTYSEANYIFLTASPPSPSVAPTSSRRSTDAYDDVTYTTYFLPGTAFPSPLPTQPPGYDDYDTAQYYVSTIYLSPFSTAAPDYCKTKWSYTISAPVTPPAVVRDQLKPTSTRISVSSGYGDDYTYVYLGLTAGALPTKTGDPVYFANPRGACGMPNDLLLDPGIFGESGNVDADDEPETWAAYQWSLPAVRAGVIAAIVIVVALFLLGFVESWFWFGRLMTGKRTWRGGTWCWAIITIWGVCLLHRQKARGEDEEEKRALEERWKGMSFAKKFALWRKWGLRWKYPESELGVQPGRVVAAQGPQQMQHHGPAPIVKDVAMGVRETEVHPGTVIQQRGGRGSVVLEPVLEEQPPRLPLSREAAGAPVVTPPSQRPGGDDQRPSAVV